MQAPCITIKTVGFTTILASYLPLWTNDAPNSRPASPYERFLLLRNSFFCQYTRRSYSETRFAAIQAAGRHANHKLGVGRAAPIHKHALFARKEHGVRRRSGARDRAPRAQRQTGRPPGQPSRPTWLAQPRTAGTARKTRRTNGSRPCPPQQKAGIPFARAEEDAGRFSRLSSTKALLVYFPRA